MSNGQDKGESDRAEFSVLCDGGLVASACGPRAGALREAMWYAFQYAQDGRVEIVETREKEKAR